jgi:hypothetical protein
MRYQQPWGVSDLNAPYINGDPSQGRTGSIPPAAAFEHPQRELVGAIEKSGFISSDNDLLQLAKAVRSQRMNYAVDTGTVNQLVVVFDPPFNTTTNPYTPGLTLHVRVRFNNTGACTINADGGVRNIIKMNSSPVGAGELSNGCIVQLIYDGSNFQLANFGGTGGINTITNVTIPYTEDLSPGANVIDARFPLSEPLEPGGIIAVKVKNTVTGATRMDIDGGAQSFNLLPNGGGSMMLQGDIVAGDVVQFFYDGSDLRFAPNPEINARVVYSVGPGQQFTTVDDAMTELRRKIIGANGHVTLKIAATGAAPIIGPIEVSHPSGDRLRIEGTMIGVNPSAADFQITGSSAAARLVDGNAHRNLMRTRYGTEIRVQNNGGGGRDMGIKNSGAGRITFADLLITTIEDTPVPVGPNGEWWQLGVVVDPGLGCVCENVAVWGCHGGFYNDGAIIARNCFASSCTHMGFSNQGVMQSARCGSFSNTNYGFFTLASLISSYDVSRGNGGIGVYAISSAGVQSWYSNTTVNGSNDLVSESGASIAVYLPADFTAASPPASVLPPPNGTSAIGSLGNIIAIIGGVIEPGTSLVEIARIRASMLAG